MIKRRLIPSLLTGALAASCFTVGAQSIHTLDSNAELHSSQLALPNQGKTSQLIVKFHGAKSLNQELTALKESLQSKSFSADKLQQEIQAKRGQIESELTLQAEQRIDLMAFEYGLNLKLERVVATGADLITFDIKNPMLLEKFKAELEKDPSVEYVEYNAMMQPFFTPNDQHYGVQWHYSEATAGLNLPTAWDTATGSGAVVAVLDTGYRPHVDLNANIIGGYDFISSASAARDGNGRDSNAQDEGDWVTNANECFPGSNPSNSSWHGTHVAGTVAAVTNNNIGVAGVAFNAKVVPVRVLGKCGGSTADIADAIIWSSGGSVSGVPGNANPADVINMSLGGGGACGSTYQSAINTAVNNGTVVIVAAGNENQNASNARPANCSNVVTVAALDRQGNRASYSNFGSVVDVAAPGGETSPTASNGVASTLNSGTTTPGSDNYVYFQGTSMATPHVAGVAALLKGLDSNMTPAAIEANLKSTSRSIPGSCSGGCGSGLVDAAASVAAVSGGGGGGGGGGGATGGGGTVENISASSRQWRRYTLTVPSGMSTLDVDISGGSGDADLYVRFGSQPSTSNYDCRPYLNGNNESCNFSNPQSGTWHIGIRAFSTFSGVRLDAFYNP